MDDCNLIKDLGIIIAAGGSGSRFASEKSKLFADCDRMPQPPSGVGAETPEEERRGCPVLTPNGNKRLRDYDCDRMPVFIHSLKNFIDICPSENLILVIKENDRADFAEKIAEYLPGRTINLVTGGETRMNSVFNGLQALSDSAKFAAVHDAARPFATAELLINCLKQAREHDGAIVARKVTDTVKKACSQNLITETIDRNELWTVETPQIFPREALICAYRKAFDDGIAATDDAGVMEHSGFQPFLFEHKGDNRKITYPEDVT